jgi:hypothetical protein
VTRRSTLLDLEGLKQWVPGRISGYAQLAQAVDRFGTIDAFARDLQAACSDLQALAFSEGGYLLVKRALRQAGPDAAIVVTGTSPALAVDLRAWCRAEGHRFEWHTTTGTDGRDAPPSSTVAPNRVVGQTLRASEEPTGSDSVAEHPPRTGAWRPVVR